MQLTNGFLSMALLLGLAPFAGADEASRLAKAEEFVRLSKLDEMIQHSMKQSMAQLRSGVLQQTFGLKPVPEVKEELTDLENRLEKLMFQIFAWDAIGPAFVKLYAEAFTDEELDGMVAFYRSPAGQAMARKSPELMNKVNEISQQRMLAAAPEFQKIVQEAMERATERQKR